MTKKVSALTDIGAVRDYLHRIEAEPRSLRTAVVKQTSGRYWKDVAVIRFGVDGAVSSSTAEHAPTEDEQAAITREWAGVQFPSIKMLSTIRSAPPMVKKARKQDVFEFRTPDGEKIIMLQVRVERTERDGSVEKSYVPFTYWDDNQWRMCEPDGELPLFGLDQLPHHKVVFIHEGAKAAAYCRWMAEGQSREAREALAAHPWGRELSHAAHLGWIGGALNPLRTDWSALGKAGIERAYIVADNDEPGKGAIAAISQRLRCVTMSVEFTDEFKPSFDLADPFPQHFFREIEGKKFYNGPSMRTLTHPATWATDQVANPTGKGRPITILRDAFKHMWAYVEDADVFVCKEMPEVTRTESVFNKVVAGFSHVHETSRLLVRSYKGRSAALCYRPDQPGLLVDYRGTSAINLHVPSDIRPLPGDPKIWLEFLAYMFPNENEREEVKRWCATLIARTDVRMSYGLLLVSETQGIGKTTLGAHILAPLVGEWNVSHPAERDIASDFNEWISHKRLAIVNEIYSGASWKAYNALKSVITEHTVTVNQKYQRQYSVDNWVHILACSNSMRALKMEHDDRRWFYPEVTEKPWPGSKFVELRQWLDAGGLAIVRHWAEQWGDYVAPNERAPMTKMKEELIEGSRSEAQEEAAALAQALLNAGRPAALAMKDVEGWVRHSSQGRVFDTEYELRRAMISVGCLQSKERIRIGPRTQHVIFNRELLEEVKGQSPEEAMEIVRGRVVKAQSLMESEM